MSASDVEKQVVDYAVARSISAVFSLASDNPLLARNGRHLSRTRKALEEAKIANIKTVHLKSRLKVRSVRPGSFSALAARSSKRVPPAVRLERNLAAVACYGLHFTLWLRHVASVHHLTIRQLFHLLFPAVQATVSPSRVRSLQGAMRDKILRCAPSAGTLPTCALVEHEFPRPKMLQREKRGQLAQGTASLACLLGLVAALW
jgi:hypothetical protein